MLTQLTVLTHSAYSALAQLTVHSTQRRHRDAASLTQHYRCDTTDTILFGGGTQRQHSLQGDERIPLAVQQTVSLLGALRRVPQLPAARRTHRNGEHKEMLLQELTAPTIADGTAWIGHCAI